jgi:hypothetical protein
MTAMLWHQAADCYHDLSIGHALAQTERDIDDAKELGF